MSGLIMNRLRDEKVIEAYGQFVEKLKRKPKLRNSRVPVEGKIVRFPVWSAIAEQTMRGA